MLRGTKHSKITKLKISKTVTKYLKDNPNGMFGKKHSKATKQKIKDKRKKQSSPFKGKTHTEQAKRIMSKKATERKPSEETKLKQKRWQLNNPNKRFSNTKIEQKIAKELDRIQISYKQNINLSNICNVDFYLPEYNIVIECDGCFYHNCKKHHPDNYKNNRKSDIRKTRELSKAGYKVFRFWEHEINESVESCINKLIIVK